MRSFLISIKAAFTAALVYTLMLPSIVNAALVIENDDILMPKAVKKIEEIGLELQEKTGVSLYLSAKKSLDGKSIIQYEKSLNKILKKPFILLCFAKDEKKVDIISSPEVMKSFDKEAVLSPFSGTIIPLLVAKNKKDDKYTAALFNGYADIADQVADSYNVELASSIGNTNRNIINLLRFVIYTSILIALAVYIVKKIKRRKQ